MFGAWVVPQCGSELPRGGSVQGPEDKLVIPLHFIR